MNIEESMQQIKTLIEAWKLDEADLNQTDINAMQVLLKENQELREALEIKSYCKYANKCNEIYDCSREEYEDMANANMRLYVENQELKKQLEDITLCRDIASGHREEIQDRETILLNQQKEFIKYLEDEIKELQKIKETELDYDLLKDVTTQLLDYKEILQKYKEITGVIYDKTN